MKVIFVDIPTVLMSEHVRVYPPSWVAYLASYLDPKIEFEYFDARIERGARLEKHSSKRTTWFTFGIDLQKLVEHIRNFDVVGIHVGVSTEIGIATSLLKLIFKSCPKIRIILGGAGIAFISRSFLDPVFDKCEICKTTLIGNLVDIDLPIINCDINMLPDYSVYAKYDLIYHKINRFHSGIPIASPAMPIMTSAGCGAHCHFCTTRGRTHIGRDLSSVENELKLFREKGVRCIQFEDDNLFGWNDDGIRRGISILQIASRMKFLGVEFANGLTVYSMNDERFTSWLAHALDDGIKIKISLPFESASDEILKAIHKPHRHADCQRLLRKLRPLIKKGLQAEVFLQIGMMRLDASGGLILESDASINKTVSFAKKLREENILVDIFFNSPIPGTEVFPLWRKNFPDVPWEELMLTEPSLFYDTKKRIWLKELFKDINNSPRV